MPEVEEAYIRRAVECADLAALRAAVFQASGDAEIAGLGPVAQLSPDDRARLVDRCVELIDRDLDSWSLRVPSDAEINEMLDMVLGVPTAEGDFELRKGVLSFDDYPFFAEWPSGSGSVPDGYRVAIIGGGFNGIATAVQLEQLGIPYTVFERRDELGGTWSINRYPDIRVDTLSSSYEFSFEKDYPWTEYFARGPEVKGYLRHIAEKFGVVPHLRLGHDLVEARFDDDTALWRITFRLADDTMVSHDVNVIVSAAGLFANPKLPDFPGDRGVRWPGHPPDPLARRSRPHRQARRQ